MNKFAKIFAALMFVFVAVGCEEEKQPEPVYDHPFTKVSFTIGDETVEGAVDAKIITAAFNETDDFSDVKIVLELNPGFTVTFPTDLDHANLKETPALNFADKNGAELKYRVNCTSNAFPLKDIKKVKINELEAGANLTLNQYEIAVKMEVGVLTPEHVTLTIPAEALLSGFTAQEDLTFDFSEGMAQPLVISNGEVQKEYTVKLDVASLIPETPESFGFQDITADFVDVAAHPYLKVFKTAGIAQIPTMIIHPEEWSGGWLPENAWTWDYGWNDWNHEVYHFLGDWEDERPMVSVAHPIVMVTLDQTAVTGKLVADVTDGVALPNLQSLVSVNGPGAAYADHIYDNGSWVKNSDPDNALAFRAAIGFTNEGKMSFATLVSEGSPATPQQIPVVKKDAEADLAVATEWNVVQAASHWPFAYRDGIALDSWTLLKNDGLNYAWEQAFGLGYNAHYNSRAVIGRTWDNKIAIAVIPNGTDDYSGYVYNFTFIPVGYSYNQLCWLCRELGWRDVFPLTFSANSSRDVKANISVNGKLVLDETDYKHNTNPCTNSAFCVSFDPKSAE